MIFKEYMVPMRDGTRLYTYCVLPDESGRWPIVFGRSPYDSRDFIPADHPEEFAPFIDAGYVMVHQSCRGTARSEGEFIPFATERNDGLDTLSWMREQSFYGGEIYPFGGSYCSYVHLAYIGTHQPDIKGALLYVMPTDMYRGMTVNGIFKQDILVPWFIGQYHKNQVDADAVAAQYPAFTLERPLCDNLKSRYEDGCPAFNTMMTDASIWKAIPGAGEALNAMSELDVPVLLMEGWYDIYIGEGTRMWEELKPEIRKKSAMLVGPWPHACVTNPNWPISFPNGDKPNDILLNWFEHLRHGTPLNFAVEDQVRYYTIGENEWHTSAYMPHGATPLSLWLNENGILGWSAHSTGERSYVYDPSDPTPFMGGSNAFCTVPCGILPDPEPNSRQDILSFVSPPLTEDITVSGHINIRLAVKSDAEDTVFFVRLTVLRDGHYLPVQESITTLCRENPDYEPDHIAYVTMNTDPVSWRFFAGECLRVDVASACWPIYAAHGNVTGPISTQTHTVPAHNTVMTGLSCITLPVV